MDNKFKLRRKMWQTNQCGFCTSLVTEDALLAGLANNGAELILAIIYKNLLQHSVIQILHEILHVKVEKKWKKKHWKVTCLHPWTHIGIKGYLSLTGSYQQLDCQECVARYTQEPWILVVQHLYPGMQLPYTWTSTPKKYNFNNDPWSLKRHPYP